MKENIEHQLQKLYLKSPSESLDHGFLQAPLAFQTRVNSIDGIESHVYADFDVQVYGVPSTTLSFRNFLIMPLATSILASTSSTTIPVNKRYASLYNE